jgi:hypothetical protein
MKCSKPGAGAGAGGGASVMVAADREAVVMGKAGGLARSVGVCPLRGRHFARVCPLRMAHLPRYARLSPHKPGYARMCPHTYFFSARASGGSGSEGEMGILVAAQVAWFSRVATFFHAFSHFFHAEVACFSWVMQKHGGFFFARGAKHDYEGKSGARKRRSLGSSGASTFVPIASGLRRRGRPSIWDWRRGSLGLAAQ